MRSKIILVIALSMGLFSSTLSAQYDTTRIDAQILTGIWESNDSVKHRIEFIDSVFEVILINSSAERPYYFPMDSLKRVSVMGYYPNWPPFDCKLNYIAPGVIEIVYSQIGTPSSRKKYFKIKKTT